MSRTAISRILAGISVVLVLALALPLGGGCAEEADYHVGLTQFMTHPAADAGREGFKAALADAGLDVAYDYQNPENDATMEQTIAQKFVDDEVDLIFSFGTRISQQCIEAAEGTGIPVVFCGITDPVAAQLVTNWTHSGEDVTGTSDMIEVDSTVDLILQILPDLESLGTIYNAGEVNSVVLVEDLNEVCDALGIAVVEVTVATPADVQLAAQSLVGQVDAIWIGTDNTVVSGLDALIQVCEDNTIPLFPSDDPSIERGGIACLGFDYYDVGYQTGEMAVRILQGTPASEIPVELGRIFSYSVNTEAAETYGVTIPQEVLDKALNIYPTEE